MKHKKNKKMNSNAKPNVDQPTTNPMSNPMNNPTSNPPNVETESELFLKEYLQRRFIKSMMLTYCITN